MTEGHAQELKTQALALQVGKRLRILLSDNNAGIDDVLLGGVVDRKYDAYRLVDQWTSYGWNVFTLRRWQRLRPDCFGAQDHGGLGPERPPPDDRRSARPRRDIGPAPSTARFPDSAIKWSVITAIRTRMKMNSDYFVALARTFEEHYGVTSRAFARGR